MFKLSGTIAISFRTAVNVLFFPVPLFKSGVAIHDLFEFLLQVLHLLFIPVSRLGLRQRSPGRPQSKIQVL